MFSQNEQEFAQCVRARLTEILETFPRVFCFPKSRINENGGESQLKNYEQICADQHPRIANSRESLFAAAI